MMFQNNPITGILFIIAVMISSRYYAIAGVVGALGSVLTAFILQIDKNAINNGLCGYNGVLTGIGIAYFHFGGDKNWLELP